MPLSGPNPFDPALRSRVIDACGKAHALCEAASAPAESPRLRWLLLLAHRHRWLWWLRVVASLLAISAMVSLAFMVRGLNWYFVAAHLLSVWFSLVVAIFASRRAIDKAGLKAVRECLKAEVCPGCGYSLRGLDDDDEGRRICPECAGTWKAGPW